ncbi:Bax inhibitor-1/YccA family protein [Brevibacillus daliensis]|uniref:Bax inhibitor-1/YccA family protein n=1 Tax=Brevibacillus daliensis TaxID=2892995 RepID=UPI001E3036AD|nr:Bax inhibitor-1/YccA family protein [Brevibacillus daliensis]
MNEHYLHQAGYQVEEYNNFPKIMRLFAISLLVATIGSAFGTLFIPPQYMMPLVILEIVLLLATMFIRRKGVRLGFAFLFAFVFINGITLGPILQYYAMKNGVALVNAAFAITTLIFVSLSVYASRTKRSFSSLGGFLFAGLIGLILVQLLNLFIPLGTTMQMFIASAGIVIFSGFILYDVSRYKNGVAEEDVPMAVLNLYLSIINLLLYVLQLLGILSSDD